MILSSMTMMLKDDAAMTTKNINQNGTYDATSEGYSGYETVTVNVLPSIIPHKAVNFYDYDGTIVQSYSAAEFSELTEMPENPTHTGLTAQGWNWSLIDAKAYVASYGKLNIGQMYITDDGATRLHIRLEDGRLSPVLGLCPDGTLTIDWGDGSPAETMTGTSTSTLVYLPHTYSQAGEYTISITPTSGSTFEFKRRNAVSSLLCKSNSDNTNQRSAYLNAIINVNLGSGVTSIASSAFQNCYSLSSITIPNGVTSIGISAFQNCDSLSSITIPNTVTSIASSAFNNCYGLGYVKFTNATPPTVSNADTFSGIPTDCVIYVPQGLLSTYTSASYYPSSTTYRYVEY